MTEHASGDMRHEGGSDAQPCSLWRRLLVMVYDTVAVVAVLMLATALAMLLGVRDAVALRDPLFTLYLLAAWYLYLAWCWRYGGMTLGMRAWRVHIETTAGGRPGWGRCLARFILSLLSAAAVGAGFLWSLLDAERRCWHDRLSATRLLHTPRRQGRRSE
jgi:uncharacterized RDD family membrane protein YckC